MVSNKQIFVGMVAIIFMSTVFAFILHEIAEAAAESAKWSGLTEKEIQEVKMAKESCDAWAAVEGVYSETRGDMYTKQCEAQEKERIDKLRAS